MAKDNSGYRPAGTHLLLDFWGATGLDDAVGIDQALREAADACGATLLDVRLHEFGGEGGVTGVALLAESHISVHTWPETGYAALDVFVCGGCDPRDAIAPLKRRFNPTDIKITAVARGSEPLLSAESCIAS
ncbi:adenosylmethionine decarboxylase (plasmid) [Ensifer sp. PDNC004]|uniref:adenosylmethionine decarboxylase n=1 Tax=Ensifer sp. PDNC004 TaxID=2811423 RepID=UPI0019658463|nr:adenosylmethionine decarboxylase [Ensifer sp. PDNC004]QRY66172.1 adenosylmethionine decarboxylase [Ensifer sp. PDNC004]